MAKDPITLVILDGWGHDSKQENNAIAMARTPNWDHLLESYSYTLLDASGDAVGLPKGQMGNSEVGHMVIGSGRAIQQDLSRINQAMIEDGFATNENLLNAIKSNSRIHLIGLVSDGGIHSHTDHLTTLLKLCGNNNNNDIHIHAILDGRDTPPKSAHKYLSKVTSLAESFNMPGITSIAGRFYSMDRDKRYERTLESYDLLTQGKSEYSYNSPQEALDAAYNRGETDEFVKPSKVSGFQEIKDNDVVIFFNFRSDRARQLSYALTEDTFDSFQRNKIINLKSFITFTNYADNIKAEIAFPKPILDNIFAKICEDNQLSQFRVAETEKYAHVTFFFNGGVETPYEGESRVLIQSPKVATYDLCPKMSAKEVCDEIVKAHTSSEFDIIISNFANADMIGHTGKLNATIEAIEFLDECLGRILESNSKCNGTLFITADHGNADCMFDEKTNQPHTAHTKSLVPFVLVSNNKVAMQKNYGTLADIAPTMLSLLGIDKPREMTGRSLLESLE